MGVGEGEGISGEKAGAGGRVPTHIFPLKPSETFAELEYTS